MAAFPPYNHPDSRAARELGAALHVCSTKLAKETGVVDDNLVVDARAVLERAGEPAAHHPDPAAAGLLAAVLRRVVARLRARWRDLEPSHPDDEWGETHMGCPLFGLTASSPMTRLTSTGAPALSARGLVRDGGWRLGLSALSRDHLN